MATTYTTILGSDSLSDGRVKINANYLTIESDIEAVQTIADAKVAYSGTVPAVGDLVVAAATDGLSIKKKVFTASQVLVSDSNGQPTSEAKGTAFNKDFGTTSTGIPTGDSVVYLAGVQTITGNKTFSGSVALGTSATATTQSANDNSTKVATTAYVDSGTTKIGITTTDVTISSSAAETTIFTATIPANNLGTNNGFVGRIAFSHRSVSLTDKVLKLKYDDTTIATVTMTPDTNADTTVNGFIDFQLLAAGTTTSQEGSITINGVVSRFNTSNTTGLIGLGGTAVGTAVENSANALALTVTWQMGNSATETFTAHHGYLSKI